MTKIINQSIRPVTKTFYSLLAHILLRAISSYRGLKPNRRAFWRGRRRERLSDERDVDERSAQYAYLDLLATTLTDHEKNLDKLIERLEEISGNLSRIVELREQGEVQRATVKKEVPETLIYMKLRINRPAEELKTILDSLKE